MFASEGVNFSFMEESRLNDLVHYFGDFAGTFVLAEENMDAADSCAYGVTRLLIFSSGYSGWTRFSIVRQAGANHQKLAAMSMRS